MADSVAQHKYRRVKEIKHILDEAQTDFHALHTAEFTPLIELKSN